MSGGVRVFVCLVLLGDVGDPLVLDVVLEEGAVD